jgi:hypothetical protein
MKHIKKFESFGSFEEERFDLGNYPVEDQDAREDECKPCEDEEEKFPGGEWSEDTLSDEPEEGHKESEEESEEERRRLWGDEATVERISSFNNFLKEAKKPTTKKEKELAAKYPPKDKITKGDFIAAAIENKKDKKEDKKDNNKEDKKDNKKEDDKKPKFGSKEWREKYAKKK